MSRRRGCVCVCKHNQYNVECKYKEKHEQQKHWVAWPKAITARALLYARNTSTSYIRRLFFPSEQIAVQDLPWWMCVLVGHFGSTSQPTTTITTQRRCCWGIVLSRSLCVHIYDRLDDRPMPAGFWLSAEPHRCSLLVGRVRIGTIIGTCKEYCVWVWVWVYKQPWFLILANVMDIVRVL